MNNPYAKHMKCPCCKGTGEVESKEFVDRKLRRHKARQLKKLGFNYREIMRVLGYKSPRSVYLALSRDD